MDQEHNFNKTFSNCNNLWLHIWPLFLIWLHLADFHFFAQSTFRSGSCKQFTIPDASWQNVKKECKMQKQCTYPLLDLLQKVWGSDLPNRNKGVGPLMYLPRLGYPVQRRWWSSSRLKEAICSTIIMREEISWLKTTKKKKSALF